MVLLLFGWAVGMGGQSLIVGIPSTNVAPKREFALAHESQGNVFESGGYWNSFTFATYCLGDGGGVGVAGGDGAPRVLLVHEALQPCELVLEAGRLTGRFGCGAVYGDGEVQIGGSAPGG